MKITLNLDDAAAALYVDFRGKSNPDLSDEDFVTAVLLKDIQDAVNAKLFRDAEEQAVTSVEAVDNVTSVASIDYNEVLKV